MAGKGGIVGNVLDMFGLGSAGYALGGELAEALGTDEYKHPSLPATEEAIRKNLEAIGVGTGGSIFDAETGSFEFPGGFSIDPQDYFKVSADHGAFVGMDPGSTAGPDPGLLPYGPTLSQLTEDFGAVEAAPDMVVLGPPTGGGRGGNRRRRRRRARGRRVTWHWNAPGRIDRFTRHRKKVRRACRRFAAKLRGSIRRARRRAGKRVSFMAAGKRVTFTVGKKRGGRCAGRRRRDRKGRFRRR